MKHTSVYGHLALHVSVCVSGGVERSVLIISAGVLLLESCDVVQLLVLQIRVAHTSLLTSVVLLSINWSRYPATSLQMSQPSMFTFLG